MPDSTHPAGGVFLSYAREDTETARRIAEAMRAFGVDAWFDQSELRGGDSWDAKIKKQIRECALFVPVISATTQARSEGYFRREWNLAVERTRDMAPGRAFVMPVVIDDTAEADASVPEEFMRYQWTRLAGGTPTPEFVTQVKRLLETPRKPALKPNLPRPPTLPPELKQAAIAKAQSAAMPKRSGMPGWGWAVLVVVVLAIGAAVAMRRSPESSPIVAAKPAAPDVAPASPAPAAAGAKSIAVLPFANLSTDKENEFFADGVHDDVITNLAKIRDLKVISRTSVLAYRDTASRNLKKIAAELGVATILEGSIRRVGDKVHMNAQLIDARTDEHLWADTFDGDTGDIFALQAKLAQKIAAALQATLTPGERALIERRPTEDQEAYELYLRGRMLHQGLGATATREQYDVVSALYERALARDPSFALVDVQLALVYGQMYWFGSIDPTHERRAMTERALKAAERLAPDSPETHYARGAFAYLCENNWPRALEEYRAAEASLPNDARLKYLIGLTHRRLGHWTEALEGFDRSASLNPNELSAIATQLEMLTILRHYPRLQELANRYLKLFPDDEILRYSVIQAKFALDGDSAAFRRAEAGLPPYAQDPLGVGKRYADALLAGDAAEADRALADPRLTGVPDISGAISDPVALHRAAVALWRGDRVIAKKFAEQAIAAYQAGRWTPRQQPLVRLAIARSRAMAGDIDAAIVEIRSVHHALAEQDKYIASTALLGMTETFTLIGRRDEALDCLRQYLAGPTDISPNEMREDPFLSGLKSDPRFEEILKSAKPL
jgi:TolB-like protein